MTSLWKKRKKEEFYLLLGTSFVQQKILRIYSHAGSANGNIMTQKDRGLLQELRAL
jgi:hypothetical protein